MNEETKSTEQAPAAVPPTKEQMVNFLQEQIEVKTLQVELQNLNTKLAQGKAEEIKAHAFIAQMMNPPKQEQQGPPPDAIPHIVTEEDLANSPDLIEQGVKVGDEVLIENPASFKERQAEQVPPPVSKQLKK
jgi:hypothetical protein